MNDKISGELIMKFIEKALDYNDPDPANKATHFEQDIYILDEL